MHSHVKRILLTWQAWSGSQLVEAMMTHIKLYWFYFCILCWRWVFFHFCWIKVSYFFPYTPYWFCEPYGWFLYTRLFNSLISISLTSLYLFIVPCHCSSLFMNQLVDVLDCLYRNKKCRTQKYNQNCEVIPGQFCDEPLCL